MSVSTFRTALAAGAALVALAAASAARPQTTSPAVVKRPGVWAQTYVDRPADPAVRFGVLPNGMRYALMRNTTPTGQASIRMRVNSGSLEETDDQQGLAHFLEHMAFKGSAHVAPGEMIRTLQRLGLSFGADTNAGTNFDNTTFQFDLPQSDAASLDTGLMLMREIADQLLIAPDQLQPERGVILSEERLRDSPAYQAFKSQFGVQLAGQRPPERFPIGKVEVIRDAPASRLRDFYRQWYRPERTTLVMVGDFDVDAVEAKIKARFADWKDATPAKPDPDMGAVERRGEVASTFSKAGAPTSATVTWAAPYDPTADTAARERRDLVEKLGLAVLNRRLQALAHGANPPFVGAGAGRDDVLKSAKLTQLAVNTTVGGWRKGLVAAVEEARRAARFGVRPDELEREVTEVRTQLATAAAAVNTRRTPQLADAIAEAAGDDEVFSSPVQDLAEFDRDAKGLTVAEVSASLKADFAGSGPIVTVSSEQPVEGGDAAVKAALDEALAAPLAAPVEAVAKPWPYGSFGPAGRVAERKEVADLGVTLVRFADGVRLTIKPTAFTKDEVLVSVRFGRGRLGMSPAQAPNATWLAPAFVQGGTRDLTFEDIQRALASKVAGAALGIQDDAFVLSGRTRPQDLATQLQLLAAYMTRPGYRPEAFARGQASMSSLLNQITATPEGVLGAELGPFSHSGDPRWRILPTPAELAAAKPSDLPALLGPALSSGPVDVTVVGDVQPEAVIAAVASTFGTLADRPERPLHPAGTQGVHFPSPGSAPAHFVHNGRPDQAVAFEAWPTTGFYPDPQLQRVLGVAADIVQTRLTDEVRTKEGATYSPGAETEASTEIPGYGYLFAEVETPPDHIAGFYDAAGKIAADLVSRPPSADEMERAKRPRMETRRKLQQTNGYWLGILANAQTDPRTFDLIRNLVPGIEKVTAADVQAAAARFLLPSRAVRLTVESAHPQAGAPGQAAIPVQPAPTRPTPGSAPLGSTGAPPPTPSPTPAPAPSTPAAVPAGATPRTGVARTGESAPAPAAPAPTGP